MLIHFRIYVTTIVKEEEVRKVGAEDSGWEVGEGDR